MAYVAPYTGPYPPSEGGWKDTVLVIGIFLYLVYILIGCFAFVVDIAWLIMLIGDNI